MSELMNTAADRNHLRWRLLTTVSALALLGSVYAVGEAKAADDGSEHPTVWIELGGQLERVDGDEERFAPPFVLSTPRPAFETISPLDVERPPRYSTGAEGKITFEPSGMDWVLSASLRYGRSNGDKDAHQQTYPKVFYEPPPLTGARVEPEVAKFADTAAQNNESHIILDFQAGKDLGLGMFGANGSSVLSLGVRFAQFNTKSSAVLKSDPDWHFNYRYFPGFPKPFVFGSGYHSNRGSARATRSFQGVGPSIAWNASQSVLGNRQTVDVALDWGMNAAFLFGRQKAVVHHQSTARFSTASPFGTAAHNAHYTVYHPPADHTRARSVIVPNVGGFAGLSFLYATAKVSFGYRADFFFGAMDGGIDVAKRTTTGFYGPFATISVGLGG